MSQGTVGWWVIGLYLRSVGIFLSITIVLSLILMQVSQNFTFLWLTYWVRSLNRNLTAHANIDDFVPEKTSVLDHSVNAIDGIVHTIINKTMSIIHKLDGDNVTVNSPVLNIPQDPVYLVRLSNDTPAYEESFYLEVYFGLAGLNLVFTIMRAFLFAYGGVQAATRIHKVLLKIIVKVRILAFHSTQADAFKLGSNMEICALYRVTYKSHFK